MHDVDLDRLIGSAPTSVGRGSATSTPSVPGAEDVAETVLGFDGGSCAHSASRVGQHKVRTLTIYELDRLIEVDLLRRDVTIYRHVSENSVDDGPGYRQQTIIEIPEILRRRAAHGPVRTFHGRHRGRADAAAERRSILPSHRVVDHVIQSGSSMTCPAQFVWCAGGRGAARD